MPNPIDLTGQRFGRLTAIYLKETGRRRKWHCVCDCGDNAVVNSDNLRSGNSTQCVRCRCRNAKGTPKHGHRLSDSETSRTYRTWQAMRRRVGGNGKPDYAGVDMDPRWAKFEAFLADMGERPDGMTIDRKDNALGYWKHNCRWASPTEQTRNRRNTVLYEFGGRRLPIAEWAKEFGITWNAAYKRIRENGTLTMKINRRLIDIIPEVYGVRPLAQTTTSSMLAKRS